MQLQLKKDFQNMKNLQLQQSIEFQNMKALIPKILDYEKNYK
jgi:hypothetical protein